jgi:hypothetical protein
MKRRAVAVAILAVVSALITYMVTGARISPRRSLDSWSDAAKASSGSDSEIASWYEQHGDSLFQLREYQAAEVSYSQAYRLAYSVLEYERSGPAVDRSSWIEADTRVRLVNTKLRTAQAALVLATQQPGPASGPLNR